MAHDTSTYTLSIEDWARVRNSIALVAIASVAALGVGFIYEPRQAQFSYLVAFAYFVSISLGALFYVMVQHLTGSAWSVTVRRLMENLMRTAPVALLLVLPVLYGIHATYEWSHAEAAHDALLVRKLGYLNPLWFSIRAYIAIGAWSVLAVRLYTLSRRQDRTRSLAETRLAVGWSAPGLFVLFLTASLASFDWIMSLDPHWWSTMFGVYYLAGGAMAFMAVLIAIALGLRSAGYLGDAIREEHYHDLGKWLFALTVFWAYIAFSQYMLIWYGNLPEETIWYQRRLAGTWNWWRPMLIVGHFVVPFLLLLPRASKRNLGLLGGMAGWLLLMHYCDLYWQVMPVLHAQGFAPHWLDAVAWLAVGSVYALAFWAGLKERPLIPTGDPRLNECMAFHNI
jgi:hypothetical protein